MTAYLQSWVPVLQSINPFTSSPTTSPLPEIGSTAPTSIGGIDLPNGTGTPTLVAFVRHCGCPFAEKETKLLAEETKKNPDLHVIIIQHSGQAEGEDWFERIGAKAAFADPSRYTLVSDPDRKIYADWGIGVLGWGAMVNGGVMEKIKELKTEGIDLTRTVEGSWRWQNSGGFAVDREGKVRWIKVAKDSGDMCDYEEAAKTVKTMGGSRGGIKQKL
jgi:hypothetical protein